MRESDLKACHDLHDGGFWKSLTVRSNVEGDTMAIINCHPAGASSQELEDAKNQIKERFQDEDVVSIYFQLRWGYKRFMNALYKYYSLLPCK